MRISKTILVCAFAFTHVLVMSQDKTIWKNKKCAVVLTYDDALDVQLTNAIPLLDSLKLKATFYLSGYFPGCREHLNEWKAAAKSGHELANHTLFHPCIGGRPGREFVSPDYDLGKYTIQRITDEIRMTNVLLQSLDGKTKRTFAYPCGDMTAGDVSYVDPIKNDFVSARGVNGEILTANKVDLFNLPCYVINGNSGENMIALVNEAMTKNGLLVFLFHGVGGGHGINVTLPEHRKLLKFLKQHEKEIWIAPMLEVSETIKDYQLKK